MTPENITPAEKAIRLSLLAQKNIVDFIQGVMTVHNSSIVELSNKMDAIDQAYARYIETGRLGDGGVDQTAANTACDVFATDDNVIPPIVVSQVDSYVAYLADVFLSGTPMFPVVSSPAKKVYADQLETLLDDHALLGGYPRQLLMFLRDGVKYNYCAIECPWESIDQFSVLGDYLAENNKRIDRSARSFTKIKRLNPRNVIRDHTVLPGDIAEHGDFAGYVEVLSKMKMKRMLNKLSKEGKVYNADVAMASSPGVVAASSNYRQDPQISDYISGVGSSSSTNWDSWFSGAPAKGGRPQVPYGAQYEVVKLYVRIMPSDMGISAPQPNTPQIWKFTVVNSTVLISAERIISAYDYLPILFGQPLEDGLGYQTQSVAEGEIGFQDAAATLFNIRFAAARRAVSDRALYVADMINPKHVNSKSAAPKIPVNISALSNKSLADAYHQIPFDMRGTESTIQDAAVIVGFSKELHGLNGPKQGQFQKGNKSVSEWNDTMAGSDNRLRLPALTLEHQVFAPLKSIMVLNIFLYGDNAVLVSQKTGETLEIDIEVLRKQALSFRMADGYTPKSKLASTEMLAQGMQMIGTSQVLQQAYGASLPSMFAHLMSLGGVKGLDEYSPKQPQQAAPPGLGQAVGGGEMQEAPKAEAAEGLAQESPPIESMEPPMVP